MPRFSSNSSLRGYKAETIGLLELAPLLQVAWADGSVSAPERDEILQFAARQHVVDDSPAHVTLNVSLERRPSDGFFDTSLRAIQAMLAGLQPDVRSALHRKLVDSCTAVAVASGGFLGRRKISDEEQLVLGHITAALEQGHAHPAAKRKLTSDEGEGEP
jgi:tellurite resistance protein